jgi:hypothetical protein
MVPWVTRFAIGAPRPAGPAVLALAKPRPPHNPNPGRARFSLPVRADAPHI